MTGTSVGLEPEVNANLNPSLELDSKGFRTELERTIIGCSADGTARPRSVASPYLWVEGRKFASVRSESCRGLAWFASRLFGGDALRRKGFSQAVTRRSCGAGPGVPNVLSWAMCRGDGVGALLLPMQLGRADGGFPTTRAPVLVGGQARTRWWLDLGEGQGFCPSKDREPITPCGGERLGGGHRVVRHLRDSLQWRERADCLLIIALLGFGPLERPRKLA